MLDNDEMLIVLRFLRAIVSNELLPKGYFKFGNVEREDLGVSQDYVDYERLNEIIKKLEDNK